MNTDMLKSLILAVYIALAGMNVAEAAEEERDMAVPSNPTNQVYLSARALELLEYYKTPERTPGLIQPQVMRPAKPQFKHLNEEYRPAWEELLLFMYRYPGKSEIGKMRIPLMEALTDMAKPESIPAVTEAFRLLCETEYDQNIIFGTQKQLMTILRCIRNEEALVATLVCLDMDDGRYVEGGPKRDENSETLREWTLDLITQPRIPNTHAFQKPLIYRKEWKALVMKYNKPGVSEKNREFLEKIKAAKYIDDPLPPKKEE